MEFRGGGWKRALYAALLVFFAVLYSFPVTDPDYFWHVTTGRWIVEHGSLPAVDPFKYTYERFEAGSADAERIKMFMRAYWLADVVMYGVDEIAGVAGMIVLRMGVYVVILAAMLRWLEARNAGAMGFVWVCLLAVQMTTIPSERPQLIAFLFFPILLKLLDDMAEATGARVAERGIAICLLMVLWANMHGSFVLGVLVIGASACGMFLDTKRSRSHADPRGSLWLAAACLVTLANPNGIGLVLEALHSRGGRSETISELASTFQNFGRKWRADVGYWGIVLLTTATLATQVRRMKYRHAIVASAMLAMSLLARRHMLYLPLSAIVIVPYIGRWLPWGRTGYACAAAALFLTVSCAGKHSLLTFDQDDGFPEGAVHFMANNPTADRLFNFYDWGGYIPYKLPDKKVFIDGRSVVGEVADDFAKILETPEWPRLFEQYDIGTAILPAADAYSGILFPLATSLIADPGWALVYADDAALVFAKRIPENMAVIEHNTWTADDFCEHILRFTDHYRPRWKSSKYFYSTRGIAFANMKRWKEAIYCLRRAVAMDATDREAGDVLRQVMERARSQSAAEAAD